MSPLKSVTAIIKCFTTPCAKHRLPWRWNRKKTRIYHVFGSIARCLSQSQPVFGCSDVCTLPAHESRWVALHCNCICVQRPSPAQSYSVRFRSLLKPLLYWLVHVFPPFRSPPCIGSLSANRFSTAGWLALRSSRSCLAPQRILPCVCNGQNISPTLVVNGAYEEQENCSSPLKFTTFAFQRVPEPATSCAWDYMCNTWTWTRFASKMTLNYRSLWLMAFQSFNGSLLPSKLGKKWNMPFQLSIVVHANEHLCYPQQISLISGVLLFLPLLLFLVWFGLIWDLVSPVH